MPLTLLHSDRPALPSIGQEYCFLAKLGIRYTVLARKGKPSSNPFDEQGRGRPILRPRCKCSACVTVATAYFFAIVACCYSSLHYVDELDRTR